MSRIGKKQIQIPANVKVEINNNVIKVSGVKGDLVFNIHHKVKVEVKENNIVLTSKDSALWGLTRALIANMVHGVSLGFEKKLEIEGVGYRAALEGSDLTLSVGFTNPVKIKCPEGIKFLAEKNVITVSGSDKAKVGEISAIIRKVKKAEPYKGKGIKYAGEKIRRKEGKKVVAAKG